MNHKMSIGTRGEALACEFLVGEGYTVTARNFRVSHDEIDIIAEDEKYIVFIEVKSRAQTPGNMKYGRPAMAVNFQKKQKLLRAVSEYLRQNKPQKQPRIDVIEVYFPAVRESSLVDIASLQAVKINHIRNAVHK